MNKVLLINQGFTLNIGDKAIQCALKRFFEEKGYDVVLAGYGHVYKDKSFKEANIHNDNIKRTNFVNIIIKKILTFCSPIILNFYRKMKYNIFISPFGFLISFLKSKELQSHIKEIFRSDYELAIIGGGQLIKTRGLFTFCFKTWSRFLTIHSKRKVIVGVGIDPAFTNLELYTYKKYLRFYSNIYLRDNASVNRAKDLFNANAKFIPDVAFLLRKYLFDKTIERNNNLYIVFPYDFKTYHYSFNKNMCEDEFNRLWVDKIISLCNSNKKVELMYTTPEDRLQAEIILNCITDINIKNKIQIIDFENLEEFVRKLQTAKKVIAARMHALILGMVAGCEVESVNISDKLVNFEKEYINSSYSVDDYCLMVEERLNELCSKM